MHVFLPIADISVSLLLMVGIGALVGLLSGMFGVGGGFLMTPLLLMVGIPATVAVASDSAQIVAATSAGAYAHSRKGNVDMKLGLIVLVGGLLGSTGGVQLVKYFQRLGNFDLVVQLTYVLMLSIIGFLMLREGYQATRKRITEEIKRQTVKELLDRDDFAPVRTQLTDIELHLKEQRQNPGNIMQTVANRLPLQVRFERAGVTTSVIFPLGLGVAVGVLTAIMGVGGGFILVPATIYILGVRTIVAVGTSLFQVFFISMSTAFQQAWQNHAVDLVLVFLLFTGSTVGAQVGSELGSRVQGPYLRMILAIIILVVMLKILIGDLLIAPEHIVSIVGTAG